MGFLHILKQILLPFATVYNNTTDMNIMSNVSSVGNTKKLDGEILHLRSLDGWLRMGLLPPPLGNFADISFLVEN